MPQRSSRVASLVLCFAVAAVAGILTLDQLLFHGFAPACSDGYAEANGTSPCRPEWVAAAPYMIALGLALLGVILSARSLTRARDRRTLVES